MVRLAVEDSDWLHLSDWESVQTGWVRTRTVLEYHQNAINRYLGKASGEGEEEDPELLSASADALTTSKKVQTEVEDWLQGQADASDDVRVRLLCGADLLESFAVPGLWEDEDIETIVRDFGIVCISREGSNPQKFVYENDVLTRHQRRIDIVTEWISNEISATKVRRAIRRGESI
ncbi:unnamed protein product, partial [Cyprideis torosa]